MNFTYIANRYGAMTALFIASAALCASVTGLLRPLDDAVYDFLRSVRPNRVSTQNILLVELDALEPEDVSVEALQALCSKLLAFRPARIGLAFETTEDQFQALSSQDALDSVVLGSRFVELVKKGSKNLPSEQGFLELQHDQVLYRKHTLFHTVDEIRYESLATALARPLLLSEYSTLPDQVFIDYLGGRDSLPIVSGNSILNDKLVPELVQNRVVLIGLQGKQESHVAIPSSPYFERISRLEVHGHAVRTLISRSIQRDLSTAGQACLLLVVALLGCLFFRHTSLRHSVSASLLCFALITLLAWLSMHSISLRLPLSAMFLAVLLSAVQCLAFRFRVLSEFVESWTLLRQSRLISSSRTEQKNLWERIGDSTYQLFYPKRLVIFELPAGSQHLKLVSCRQCDPDEIIERRRDIGRSPFKEAVELGSPASTDVRRFFATSEDGCEFLVPLIASNKVFGFMVLQVDPNALQKWPGFQDFLSGYASDVASVLAQQATAEERRRREESWIERLHVSPEEEQRARLFESDTEFERRNQFLRQAFDISQTPSAVFDAFGQLAYCNRSMHQLLQEQQVAIDGVNCIELLESLSRQPIENCRKLFRTCIQDGESQSVFIGGQTQFGSRQKLTVEPVTATIGESKLTVRSLCVQVVHEWSGTTQVEAAQYQHREHDLSRLLAELRRSASALHSDRDLTGENEIEGMLDTLDHCDKLLDTISHDAPENTQEVRATEVIQAALEQFEEPIAEKELFLVNQLAETPSNPDLASDPTVLVNRECLDRIVGLILECLLSQATPETGILVRSDVGEQVQRLAFENLASGNVSRKASPAPSDDGPHFCGVDIQEDVRSLLKARHQNELLEVAASLTAWGASLTMRCCDDFRLNAELVLPVAPSDNKVACDRLPPDEQDRLDDQENAPIKAVKG